jgi:hypothetical protein
MKKAAKPTVVKSDKQLVLIKGIPVDLWRVFRDVAIQRGFKINSAATQAFREWIK